MIQMSGRRISGGRRDLFKEPLGTDLDETELKQHNAAKMITVGDVVSLTVRRNGMTPLLSIYDGYTERHEMTGFATYVESHGLEEKVIVNPAGTVTCELEDAIRNAITGEAGIIRVEGEEDLAVMPCILNAPDGYDIIYGWPGKGMMCVTTDEHIRKRVKELWNMMEDFE